MNNEKKGFALVFVAGLLLVLGVILISTFPLEIDKQAKALDRNENKLEEIRRALSAYAANNGVFPCPADQDALLNSGDFGAAADATTCDNEGEVQGALPVRTLGLPTSYAFDSWQRRFLYVVDNSGGDNIQITDAAGVKIRGEGGGEIQKFSAVVLSHGKNGKGAYNRGASSSGAVTPTQTNCASGGVNEQENCDGDAVFVEASPTSDYDDLMIYITPCSGGSCDQSLWLDASDSTLINAGTPSDGDAVEVWADSSGSANNVVQSLGTGVRPVWGADTINEKKVITFDGNDYLQSLTSFFETNKHSVFVVAESTANADDDMFGTGSATNGQGDVLLTNNSSKFRGQFYTDSSANTADSTNASVTYPSLYNQVVDDTTISLFRNGTQEKATTALVGTKNNKTKSVFIGARSASDSSKMFNGNIAEVIAYPYAVTQDEREQIECDMAKKWGVFPRTGLQAWFDGNDIDGDGDTSDNPSNGTAVATWTDKSGNARDATQATSGSRPLMATDTITTGKKALSFDGTDDILGTAAGIYSGSAARSIFAVYKSDVATGNASIAGQGLYDSPATWFSIMSRADYGDPFLSSWGLANGLIGPLPRNTSPKIAHASYNGTTSKLYKNSGLLNSATRSLNTISGAFLIGGNYYSSSNFLNGDIGEILVYNRVLAEGERKMVDCYLSGKWDIDIKPALISHWKLDNNANDEKNTNTLTAYNTPTYDSTTQKVGTHAAVFNGTNQYFSAGNGQSLQVNTGTVCAWFKTSDATYDYNTIVAKQSAYGLFVESGDLKGYDWGGNSAIGTSKFVADNIWHHACLSFQSGVTNGTEIYLDGNSERTTTITVANQNEWLGIAANAASGQQFTGSIDDVRLYDRPLTATEVLALYNDGL